MRLTGKLLRSVDHITRYRRQQVQCFMYPSGKKGCRRYVVRDLALKEGQHVYDEHEPDEDHVEAQNSCDVFAEMYRWQIVADYLNKYHP